MIQKILPEEHKYIIFKNEKVELTHYDDGQWYDPWGTIFALSNTVASVDHVNACGVAPFDLPTDFILTPDCTVHDYMYGDLTYQLYHTREEADLALEDLIEQPQNGWASWLADPFYWLTRMFGGFLPGKKWMKDD